MTDGSLSQAELFDVFSNARRRQAVQYLTRQDGACDLSPLVERVAAWENETTTDEVTRAQRRRVYISLYQTHLPMLEDHGIVDWDPDAHRIELLPSPDLFEPYLDRRLEPTRAWHWYYAGLTGVTTLLAVVVLVTGIVSLAPVALALCLGTLALSLAHSRSNRGRFTVPFGS